MVICHHYDIIAKILKISKTSSHIYIYIYFVAIYQKSPYITSLVPSSDGIYHIQSPPRGLSTCSRAWNSFLVGGQLCLASWRVEAFGTSSKHAGFNGAIIEVVYVSTTIYDL